MQKNKKQQEIAQNLKKFGKNAGIFSAWIADGVLLQPYLGAKLGLIQRMASWYSIGNIKSNLSKTDSTSGVSNPDQGMLNIIFFYTKIQKYMDCVEDQKFMPYVKKWCVQLSEDPIEFMHAQNSTIRNQMIKSLNDSLEDILKYVESTENKSVVTNKTPLENTNPILITNASEIKEYIDTNMDKCKINIQNTKVQIEFSNISLEISYISVPNLSNRKQTFTNNIIKAVNNSFYYRGREIKLSASDSLIVLDHISNILNKGGY